VRPVRRAFCSRLVRIEPEVEEDDKKNDLKYYVGVGIDF
jgi:hypothetical protein